MEYKKLLLKVLPHFGYDLKEDNGEIIIFNNDNFYKYNSFEEAVLDWKETILKSNELEGCSKIIDDAELEFLKHINGGNYENKI